MEGSCRGDGGWELGSSTKPLGVSWKAVGELSVLVVVGSSVCRAVGCCVSGELCHSLDARLCLVHGQHVEEL